MSKITENTIYAIIDSVKNGDTFEDRYQDLDTAIRKADYFWGVMTDYDKNRRDSYAVYRVALDEEDCIDYYESEVIKRYK